MESSRIFVRGLPPKFTEDDVRKHFSKYTVTDVKFFPHRRIGYVGYKTPEDAAKAVKYFNKSFIRMSKIFVEIAKPISDHSLPKSHRQRKEEKSGPAHVDYVPPQQDNKLKRKRVDEEAEKDPKLKEFLEVMQAPSKTKTWTNDDAQMGSGVGQTDTVVEAVVVPEGESDDEYQAIGKKAKTSHEVKQPSVEAQPQKQPRPPPEPTVDKSSGSEALSNSNITAAAETGPVSDADWLRSRTNRVLDLVDDDEEPSRQVHDSAPAPGRGSSVEEKTELAEMEMVEQEKDTPNDVEEAVSQPSEVDKIRQTARLYLRNLHYDITSDDLQEHFSKYGPLEEVHVPMNKSDGKAKGFAFVQFQDPEHAVEAYSQNDGTIFQGRLLHIIHAESKRNDKLDEFAISKLPLKKQKEIKRKATAGGSTFNWNSLYMNADAVMSVVAERLGVSKADVLDPTSSDAAVKLAHAETHIIQEIKSYFAQHGVNLEAFKKSAKGDVAILVKNIPHGAKSAEIRELFENYGTVSKFLMPPAGITAIVEFSNSAQAQSAFRSLAYRKIKDSILYLEKAPKDLFKDGVTVPATSQLEPLAAPNAKLAATDLLQDAPVSPDTATLYVRNLNFSTTTERLSDAFSHFPGFRSARVKTKTDPKRGVLSMGFGFVEFNNAESAAAALRAMDGYSLHGHALQIKVSHKGGDAAEARRKEDQSKKAASTKIIIKNLPFEATKKDVQALFAPYGQLRSVRVPKKSGPSYSSRGFGFAEFITQRDAANAMDSLRNTHLLGRRLVLAFAEVESEDPEKELEKMQQKVEAQTNKVALQRLTGGGRKKFNVAGNDDLDEA
ncbi:RNA-binding domain-containing protein [Westerdykella ornata]|uniref:Multiple RNA-binding domain-containing protein 1 n=1 Tax=Westerdykella ornata TaxID=318751 RepID=A0A6A6JLZ8_WESOR|nr:RNA-binding domain-containing protein [Westerdykella ornata]KAF2276968.1 RNA-binding domain-containing protein [Westerdykella ornata]